MGLILDARSSLYFFETIAYGKAEVAIEEQDKHSGSLLMERYLSAPMSAVSEALSKELDSGTLDPYFILSDDDYQIESSTDLCPCKKRCHFMMTTIALWYLMNIPKSFFSSFL